MKNWKKQWKTELDAIIPSLDEKVLKEPIPVQEKVVDVKQSKVPFIKKGALAGIVSFCAVMVLTVAIALSGIIPTGGQVGANTGSNNGNNSASSGSNSGNQSSSSGNDNQGSEGGSSVTPSTFKYAMATVEVNPVMTFVLNEEGNVECALAGNTDADVILANQDFSNMDFKTAVKTFVDLTAQLGFLDVNGVDVVRVSSLGDVKDEWIDDTNSELTSYFDDNNIKSPLISEKVDFDKFTQRSNLGEFDNGEDMYAWGKNADKLYTHRQMKGKTESEVAEYFNTEIINGVFKEELFDEIEDYLEDFLDLKELLNECPNYWHGNAHGEVKKEIDEIIDELKEDYGVIINNETDYLTLIQKIESVDLDGFTAEITSLLEDGNIANVKQKIKELGINSFEEFDDLEDLPTSVDDVEDFINGTFSKKHNNMKKQNEGKVHEEREDFDYEDFMQGVYDKIENEFGGSLDDFFNDNKGGGHGPGGDHGNRPNPPHAG